jgi:DNA segregation ATPase FtsK/SpoIIIE-like protein
MAVRVRPEPRNAGRARLHALPRDPLEAASAQSWPWADSPATSLWHPVPVGVDEDGQPVSLTLFEHNLLVGGEPGAGKSVALSQLVAAAALDPFATLWLLDGKVVELAAWRRCARGFAGADITEATLLLLRVHQMMDDRYRELLEAGRRKMAHGSGVHVVVIDELALYSTWPERKARDHFAEVLRDPVARGRAAGVIVVVATQKPSSEVVPTSLRDLFGYRWALRCTTHAASDTILGSGWATAGISAASINAARRGVGWLLHESGQPVRLRAFHLDDHDIDAIATRAASLRTE